MSQETERDISKTEICVVLLIVAAFVLAIGIVCFDAIKDKERYPLEAMKIHQVMTSQKEIDCKAIRRIDTGISIQNAKCYGTATCAANDTEAGLTIYNAISGKVLRKIYRTSDRKSPYTSYGADYEEFHNFCISYTEL
jgi:hypothetical protein